MLRLVGKVLPLAGSRFSLPVQRRMFSSGVRDKLLLTLASPSECFFNKTPVFSVSVPGAEGTMTLTNMHQPIISRLKAGQVEVVLQQGEQPKLFFLSDGFLFLKPPQDDSGCCTAEVVGVEMVPSSVLDKEAAVQQLQKLLQEGASSSDSWTKAKTLLGQELLSAVIRAAP